MIQVSKELEAAILQRVKHQYDYAAQNRDSHKPDWDNARAQINQEWTELEAQRNTRTSQRLNYIYVPTSLKVFHRTRADFQHHYFPMGHPKIFRVQPSNPDPEDQIAAFIMGRILEQKAEREIGDRLRRAATFTYDSGLVEGTGAAFTGWDKKNGNRPVLQHMPLEHCCWDPWPLVVDDVTYFCRELWLTEDQLWDGHAKGIYKNVRQIVSGEDQGEVANDPWRTALATPTGARRLHYKVVEYWGPEYMMTDLQGRQLIEGGALPESRDIVCAFHSNKALLRLDDNTYAKQRKYPTPYQKLPIQIMTPVIKRNSVYGDSMILWIREIQREINLTRNQRRRAVDLEMTRRTFFNSGMILDPRRMAAARYGGYVPVDGDPRAAIHDQQFTTSTANMTIEYATMEREVEQITGVSDTRYGIQGPNEETATAASLRASQGDITQDTLLINTDAWFGNDVAPFWSGCIREYVTSEEAQAILGWSTPVPPLKKALDRDYVFTIKAGGTPSAKLQQQRSQEIALQHVANVRERFPELADLASAVLVAKIMAGLDEPEISQMFRQAAGTGLSEHLEGAGRQRRLPASGLTPEMPEAQMAGPMRQPAFEETSMAAGPAAGL